MGNLREALNEEKSWDETWNGADCKNTTGSDLLDFFATSGSLRGAEISDKLAKFDRAYTENADYAMKLLFYTRDIRGGYGERDTFNQILADLANHHPESVEKNLWAIMEFGRAKDLYALVGTKAEDAMWKFMKDQFELDLSRMEQGESVSLLAKWIATPNSSSEKTKTLANKTARKLGYKYTEMKQYRKKLTALRSYINIPEALMCAGRWSEIEYEKCCSRFLLTYSDAFEKHDNERWLAYLEKVSTGEKKINTSTLTPCDIIYRLLNNLIDDKAAEAMWNNLEDVVTNNVLVMCDTSGSMMQDYYNNPVRPIDVALSLSMYFAERLKGDLKNMFMTFSSFPELVEIKGSTLSKKCENMSRANWGMTTNLSAAFDLLLNVALEHNIKQEDMPEALLIVSDMQINCIGGERMLFYNAMSERYERYGYKLPHVIFWNVNASKAVFHAAKTQDGVSMCSGYSVNVLKQVTDNIGKTPMDVMMDVINDPRYKDIVA